MAKLEALVRRRCAVLRLSVHESASEVSQSSSIFRALNLDLHAASITQWHPEWHVPKGTYTMHKPVYFNRKPVTDIQGPSSARRACTIMSLTLRRSVTI